MAPISHIGSSGAVPKLKRLCVASRRMVAEATQQAGKEGVARVKQWLESTTYIDLPFNVYENQNVCTMPTLGKAKRFDLRGYILPRKKKKGQPKRPLLVESKRYSVVGGQPAEFQVFLAIAYSVLAREEEDVGDCGTEFMWVTSHPFSQSKWAKLTGRKNIREALRTHSEYLGADGELNEDTVERLSDRLWLLVFSEKQHDQLMLSTGELWDVHKVLKRK